MPGYQSAKQTVSLTGGARIPVTLELKPVLVLRLQFPADGSVAINNEGPVAVHDGQFLRDLLVGTYSVALFTGRSGRVAFAFEVRPEGPAVITALPTAQEVSALLVNHFGDETRIYTGASPVDVKLDGQALGRTDKNGLDLPPKLSTANHELELGAGKDSRKHAIEISPERTLTLIIASDPNTGTLLVQTNEDDATIVVLLNGKEVKRGTPKKGTFRVANLYAGKYSVRASKEGYDVDFAEQPAEVQKGEDKTVSFQFRRQALLASVNIRLTPGSELFVDGNSLGTTQEDSRVVKDLKAGTHTFRAEKGKQFRPNQKPLELAAGQSSDLDLRLTLLPVPVEIKRTPPNSTVTYTRAGDPTVHAFTGTRQDLPEGDYRFIANADGYLQRAANEHISWDSVHPIDLAQAPAPPSYKMADWGAGVWTPKTSYSVRDAAGFILFPKPLGYVQFTMRMQGAPTQAVWLLHYVNEKNFIRCEIDDEGFRAVRISETKSREVLTGKKDVTKLPWYTIRILIRPDGATILSRNKDATWEPLGDVTEPGFGETKFGFYVPKGQQLLLAGFDGQSFR